MGRKYVDISNKVTNKVKVIRRTLDKNNKGSFLWECECLSCGTLTYLTSSDVNRNRSGCKSCIDLAAENSPYRKVYGNYKRNAERRGHPFEITFEDFKILVKSPCTYCSHPGTNTFNNKNFKVSYMKYNGVDRIDNNKGYTSENSAPCCKFCNLGKSVCDVEEFNEWLEWVQCK